MVLCKRVCSHDNCWNNTSFQETKTGFIKQIYTQLGSLFKIQNQHFKSRFKSFICYYLQVIANESTFEIKTNLKLNYHEQSTYYLPQQKKEHHKNSAMKLHNFANKLE